MIGKTSLAYPLESAEEMGLTKREYFAGLAMQGLTAYHDPELHSETAQSLALRSVALADALITELNK